MLAVPNKLLQMLVIKVILVQTQHFQLSHLLEAEVVAQAEGKMILLNKQA